MKYVLSAMLLLILLSSCRECETTIINDGKKPKASIKVCYTIKNVEQCPEFPDHMSIIPVMGLMSFVPKNAVYAAVYTCSDGGCIQKMSVSKIEWPDNPLAPVVVKEFDFSDCAQKSRIWAENDTAPVSNWRTHIFKVVDFSGAVTEDRVTLVPCDTQNVVNPAGECAHTGILMDQLKWNGDIYHNKWQNQNSGISTSQLSPYCAGRVIKEISCLISSEDCERITSSGWHVSFDSTVIDIPSTELKEIHDHAKGPISGYSFRHEVNQPIYVGLIIHVWADEVYKACYVGPCPGCNTATFNNLFISLFFSD